MEAATLCYATRFYRSRWQDLPGPYEWFRAVLDPDTDRLFCKEAETCVELEVASLTADPIAVSATEV